MDVEDREVAGTALMADVPEDASPFASEQQFVSVANTTAQQFPRSLQSINAEFFHHVSTYKQYGGQNVFLVALMEYLRVLKSCRDSNSSVYDSLYQKVCDAENNLENLKSIVTVDMWEKIRHFVEDLDSDPDSIPHSVFTETDFPTAKARYGLVHVSDNGSIRVDRVALGDMNMQDVTQAMGLAVQSRIDEEEPTDSYHWHTFHITKLPHNTEINYAAFTRAAMAKAQNGTTVQRGVKNESSVKTSMKAQRSQMYPDDKSKFLDGEPREYDVKFGRGGGTNNHKGNVMYLLEKLRLQPAYTLLATGRGKTCISMQLVAAVHAWGGRFVARDDTTERWFEVDLSTARRKASQTLREDKTPAEQEQKRLLLARKLEELERHSRKRCKTDDPSDSGETLLAGETLLQLNGDQPIVDDDEHAV